MADKKKVTTRKNASKQLSRKKFPGVKVSTGEATKPAAKKATTGEATKPVAKKATTGEATKPVAKKATTGEATKPAAKKATTGKATKPAAKKTTTGEATKPAAKKATAGKATKPATKKTAPQPQPTKTHAPKENPLEPGLEHPNTTTEEPTEAHSEVILTDAEGRRYCSVSDCDQVMSVESFCRYHYLLFWKQIQVRKTILSEGKLEQYIRELISPFSNKFIEVLKSDLSTRKSFLAATQELEIEVGGTPSASLEEEDRGLMDEVRGVTDGNSPSSNEDDYP